MPGSTDSPRSLRADCERCFALCCVAPALSASADFAISKPAGQPCPNLLAAFRCAIHERLRPAGFPGCAAYDCFGAGQQVAQVTFGGQDWRQVPGSAPRMFEAFVVMRQLHEMLWYLREALAREPARPLHADLRAAYAQTDRLTRLGPDELSGLDVAARRGAVATLLHGVSDMVRASGADTARTDLAGADLIGKNLRGADLRRASLRGALLIRADLRGADLRLADVLGADLRGADLRGADLSTALFLVRPQVDAAADIRGARLPPSLAGRHGAVPARQH